MFIVCYYLMLNDSKDSNLKFPSSILTPIVDGMIVYGTAYLRRSFNVYISTLDFK